MVPILRFKEFDLDWKQVKLKDITDYTKGFAFKSNDYHFEGERIVRVSDLGSEHIKYDNEKIYITSEKADEFKKYRIKKGNIIVTTVGSRPDLLESAVGRGIYVEKSGEGLLNQNLLKFENIKGVNNRFVSYYINTPRYVNYIKIIKRGNANQSNITVKDLLDYKVSISGLVEQQKIADFLSSVDKKISLLKQKHSLLQQYKKGVMQQLFSQQIRFKDDNCNDFPDWQEKTLAELADKVSNKNKDDAIKNVLTNSAKHGIVNQRDYFDKDIANENNLTNYSIVDKDDFVYNPRISELAPVGPIKRNHIKQGIMSPLYTVFRFKDAEYLDYLELFFQTTYWHRYMNTIANFGARHDRMNITVGDFFKLPINLPSEEEMQKIVSFVTLLNKKVDFDAKQIELTKTFKKGLLQQMFV